MNDPRPASDQRSPVTEAEALPPFDSAPTRAAPSYVGLQYLRAVGALLVVYYHSVIQVNGVYGPTDWWLFGRCGVDVFFVLSGFVMWTSTAQRGMRPGLFLRRRLARIVPLYWAVTIGAALIALIAPRLLRSTEFDLPHLIASLLFVPWTNPAAIQNGIAEKIVPVVVPGWTLNFEMLFYVLFAVALLVPRPRRAIAVVGLVTLTYFAARALAPLGAAPEFYAQTIIFEFALGVLLAVVTMRGWSLPSLPAAAILALGTLALVILDTWRPPVDRLAALGIPAFAMVAAMVALERHGRVPMIPALDALGNASYSIYLVHIYVIAMLRLVFNALGLGGWSELTPVFIVIALLVSAIVGLASYYWLEIPAVLRARRLLHA